MQSKPKSAIAIFLPRGKLRTEVAQPSAADLQHRYLGTVFNYVVARIGAGAEAEDITAEVFSAAFRGLHQCPRQPATDDHDPVRAWLLGIARRKLADVYRRRTRRPESALDVTLPAPTSESPEALALAEEATQTLRAILEELPELQREVLRLKYLDELTLVEIGMVLGKSPNAVGQLLHRARQAVRERGIAYFGEDGNNTEISR